MSREVDSRVVQMEFDNTRFEQNVKTSMDTLSKLNTQLEMSGAKAGLDEFNAKANSMNLSNISSSVDALSNRFSTLGIVGMTAIQNITNSVLNLGKNIVSNVFNKIKNGGLTRALNLENAKFQIEGLKHNWEDLKEQISYGVKDTAYGLDASAKAAAQLLASGVKYSKNFNENKPDQMARTLRAISGVAAMTNSEYEEMSNIFTTVAGNGRLMSQQLLQMSTRGLNAAATIRDYFNSSNELMDDFYQRYTSHKKKNDADIKKGAKATEENIRTMTTNGAIDFKTFADAMDWAFGEHAKKANETYEGSLRNVGAALSRLGAKFQDIRLKKFRDVFVNLIPLIDSISAALDPLVEKVDNFAGKITNFATFGLKYLTYGRPDSDKAKEKLSKDELKTYEEQYSKFKKIGEALENLKIAGSTLGEIFSKIFKALTPEQRSTIQFINKMQQGLVTITNGIKTFANTLKTGLFLGDEKFGNISKYMKSFSNIRGALASFGTTISNITKSIFSGLLPTSGNGGEIFNFLRAIPDHLLAITNGMQTLAVKIKGFFSDEKRLENIKDIFGGIKSAILLVKDVFVGFINLVKPSGESVLSFADAVGEVIDKVLRFGGDVGRFITDLREWLKTSDEVAKFFNSLKDTISSAASPIITLIKAIKDSIMKLFSKNPEAVDMTKEFASFDEILERASSALDRLKNTLDKVKNYIKGWADKIKNTIKDVFSGLNPGKAISLAIILGSLRRIFKALQTGYWTAKKISWGITGNIVKFFDSLKGALINFNKSVKERRLKDIATSLLELAIAMMILASIDEDKMEKAMLAMTVFIGELIASFQALQQLDTMHSGKGGLGKIGPMTTQLMKIAAAMLILSVAVKIISKLEPEQVAQGVVAIGSLLTVILGFMEAITKRHIDKAVPSLTSLAVAMAILAVAIKIIGSMSPEKAIQGVVAIGVILGEIFGFLYLLDKFDVDKEVPSLIALSVALGILAVVIKILGSMPFERALQGCIVLGLIFVEIFAFMTGLDRISTKETGSLLALAASMAILSAVIKTIGSMPFEQALQGVIALGLIMIEVFALMTGLEGLSKIGGNAKALIIISASLLILAEAIKVLGALDIGSIAKGLITMAIALGIILGAAALAESLAIGLAALSGVLMAVGAACVAAGLGIFLFAAGLTALVALGGSGLAIIVAGILAIINVIPLLLEAIGSGLVKMLSSFLDTMVMMKDEILTKFLDLLIGLLDMILVYMPQFIEKGALIIIAFLQGINSQIGEITKEALKVVVEFLNGVADQTDDLVEAGLNVIIAILEGFAEKIDDVAEAGADVIVSFLKGIQKFNSKIIQAGWDLIIDMINGISDSVSENMPKLRAAIKRLGETILDEILKPIADIGSDLYQKGVDAVQGFINGVHSLLGDLWNKGVELANKFLGGIASKKGQDSSSPSKKAIKLGHDAVNGYVVGVEDYYGRVYKTGSNLGNKFITAVEKSISTVSDIISSDMSLSPTITPVIDLNSVKMGVNDMNSMLANTPLGINANIGSINTLMAQRQARANGTSQVIDAIHDLKKGLEDNPTNVYNLGGITYDDDSRISAAVNELISAIRVEGRV